ncbi:Poly A polymerase head domain [Arabidopsis thaliana x Arabidopsis arenosa]|uniref:Poly A polymerase head domain n=1 Tax=Arabidopsis thaliana x Arabidopsis arenosa TaxID=1240361 RepID=A0A8T2C096_9BRAS|nr:Poly A polymerase head domain [Arabidopsis thaliana x Arabidopsis arenosa]
MRLSLPINTLLNLPKPLFLISPSRYRNPNRSLTVAFRTSSTHLRVSGVSSRLCCYWFPTKAMTTNVGEEDKQSIPPIKLKENIELTDKERKIFDRLLSTLRYCNLDTQLRVAGGWVRDKLLGKESDDIDIAIDNMSGSEFLDKFKEYLSSRDEEVQGDTIIERNPDQSKHLETAKMRIYDQWIDFVNLRSEEYTENSRIPTMKFGTAKEDAFRRDLTINSLFYNINSGSVEDLTERGIDDLKSGKIVTPLPAKATFLDDPLRVLRAIRFGARFGFTLDEELKEAASSEEVRVALGEKISRERIGNEIDLMISGNGPVSAVTYLSELKLFTVVFSLPSSAEPSPSEYCGSLSQAYLEAMWSLLQTPRLGNFSGEQRRLALYAAMFLPFRKTVYKDSKGKSIPVVNHIFKFSMKRKTSDSETVMNIHQTMERFRSLIPSLAAKNDVELDELDWAAYILDHWKAITLNDPLVPATSKIRVLTGFLLRDIKDFWRVSLLTSLLLSATVDGMNEDQDIGQLDFQLEKMRETYLTVEATIHDLGLDSIWDAKPLVNGREIMQIAELKGGSLIREWQQKLLTWQLAYPNGTAEECKEWMRYIKAKRQRTE